MQPGSQYMIISPRVSCPILVLPISQLSLIEILVPGGPGTGSAVPHMQKILRVYRAEGLYNREFAPFLNGYIGEHIEFYRPGAMQLAGLSGPPRSNMSIGELILTFP